MKVYMDDRRETPEGWTRTYTAYETIELLKTGSVKTLSLDNDLGLDQPEGYNVMNWIEEQVFVNNFVAPEEIIIHSSNTARKSQMEAAIHNVRRHNASL